MNIIKKSFALLLSLQLLLFCGCSAKSTSSGTGSEHKRVEIILPDDNTVNGYRKKGKASSAPGSITAGTVTGNSSIEKSNASYFGNANTHIFHTPDCPALKKTKPENRVAFSSRTDAVSNGYAPCKKCSP